MHFFTAFSSAWTAWLCSHVCAAHDRKSAGHTGSDLGLMVKHKGIGMNRPIKKKVKADIPLVRLRLSGYAPAIAHEVEFEPQHEHVTPPLPPASPGKLHVDYMYAEVKVAAARRDLAEFDAVAAEKHFYAQHRIYDAQIRMLQKSKRQHTNSLSELEKMESRIEVAKLNLLLPCLDATFDAQSARMGWLSAHAEAKCAECDRLKRLLRRV